MTLNITRGNNEHKSCVFIYVENKYRNNLLVTIRN